MKNDRIPLVFGETLFDQFQGGTSIMGGAPFNVAWHLQGFNMQPMLITAIGQDEKGKQVQKAVNDWGLNTQGIQIISGKPTGVVKIELKDREPEYSIMDEQAYDYIESEKLNSDILEERVKLIYHGSLALRHSTNMITLQKIISDVSVPVYVDINLRAPWWTAELVKAILNNATYLKCSAQELHSIAKIYDLDHLNTVRVAQQLLTLLNLQFIVVTSGANEVFLVDLNTRVFSVPPMQIKNFRDSVGAGDAFTAVIITGLLKNWEYNRMLQIATDFAAEICQQEGATRFDKVLYTKFGQKWKFSNE